MERNDNVRAEVLLRYDKRARKSERERERVSSLTFLCNIVNFE